MTQENAMMKSMNQTVKSILPWAILSVAFVAHAADRKPSSVCKFDIKSAAVRSDSPVESYDKDSDKLVQVFPELTDFEDLIPNSVSLKIQYSVDNCREPLTARVDVVPVIGSPVDFDDPNASSLMQQARQKAVAAKPWVMRQAKIQKLSESGEIVVPEVPVLKYFEGMSKNSKVWAVNFVVVILEDSREVARKDITVEAGLQY